MEHTLAQTPRMAGPCDLEMESVALGPATRMTLVAADAEGRVAYQFGKRRQHAIALTRQYAGAPLLLLDSMRWALLLDPQTHRLEMMTFFSVAGSRTILMGGNWGKWIDEHGAQMSAVSIPELMLQWNLPATLYENHQTLGLEFHINIFNREVFTPNTLLNFRDSNLRHSLELQFGYPLGGFRVARIKAEDEKNNRIESFMDLAGFPLIVPEKMPEKTPAPAPSGTNAKAAAQAAPAGGGAAQKPQVPPQPPPRSAAAAAPGSHAGPSATHRLPENGAGRHHAPPHTANVPHAPNAPHATNGPHAVAAPHAAHEPPRLTRTEHLSVPEMLTVLVAEINGERRWKMIEANLLLGRPERTYPLLTRYSEAIGERTAQWPAARLKAAFTHQPGTVLLGIMNAWTVTQVLAVAEGNGETAKIMEWLRERELERLLRLDLGRELVTADDARRALRVDRGADEAAVKKTWRTLLGFMNADLGRSEERAIHRKKDEIAKYLQAARNILLKQK